MRREPTTFNAQPSRSVWNNAFYADNYPYLDVNTYGQEQIYGVLVGN